MESFLWFKHQISVPHSVIFFSCLNASVLCFLFQFAGRSPRRLGYCVLLLSILVMFSFLGEHEYDRETIFGYIKVLCVLPLGLGATCLFGVQNASTQLKWKHWYNSYINIAVLGNVGMMLFVPVGNTMRGLTSKLTCVVLLLWLVKEVSAVRWMPVGVDKQGTFTFSAAPLSWVFCHSMYRFVLITLPAFDTRRYLFMEPASLLTMLAYYQYQPKKQLSSSIASKADNRPDRKSNLPMNYYFGAADTLVIATFSALSKLTSNYEAAEGGCEFISEEVLDYFGVMVHMLVISFSLIVISGKNYRKTLIPSKQILQTWRKVCHSCSLIYAGETRRGYEKVDAFSYG